MLRRSNWLILKLWYLMVMLNAWSSLANSIEGCAGEQFRCTNGLCIPLHWRCDGDSDCSDGSDEDPSTCLATCPPNHFACRSIRRCIYKSWVCDNEDDCGDNSDEENCSAHTCQTGIMFTCSDNKCIPSTWRCDGDADCTDGSDELDCKDLLPQNISYQNISSHCRTDEFSCGDKTCMPRSFICDGVKDCSDGSDEQNCTALDLTCDQSPQFECGNGSCIPLSSVCDSKPDCPGAEDEQPHLCSIDKCLLDNGGCSQICIELHIGVRCECENGYKLIDNKTCDDIDECMEPESCSQFCTNQIGGFNCSCAPGYLTDPLDYTRCKAAEGNASLLIGGLYDIYQVALDPEENMTAVINDITIRKSLDFDYRTGMTFWTDGKKIYKDHIDDAHNQTVMIDADLTMPVCLAVDWIYNRIYWTDARNKTIQLANFEFNMRKTIIDDRLQNPRAIVVNPLEGWMFWTDLGENTRIERAGMDGSHRSIIIATEISYPSALTLDLVGRKLYWVDAHLSTIASCNYDGSGRRATLHSPDFLSSSDGLTTFEDYIFWSNWDKMGIFKANKFTGEGVQAVIPLGSVIYPKTVQIYHPSRQPDGKNHCENFNGHCSHLCLPAPEINSTSPLFTCACPDGLELLSDGLTCFENSSSDQQTSICDHIEITPGQQNISEIHQLCQALKIAEEREILHKAQLEEIRRQNAELLREQKGRCQQQPEDLRGDNIRNRRGIAWLFKEPEFE